MARRQLSASKRALKGSLGAISIAYGFQAMNEGMENLRHPRSGALSVMSARVSYGADVIGGAIAVVLGLPVLAVEQTVRHLTGAKGKR